MNGDVSTALLYIYSKFAPKWKMTIYLTYVICTLSQKNVPTLVSCCFDKHGLILMTTPGHFQK